MKKEILLFWFGDNKPPYVDWNVENFKKMNPNWEVKFIEYSLDQIINHRFELNDDILCKSFDEAKKTNHLSLGDLGDIYKGKYIENFSTDGIIINFDLDCFPICHLDDFFINTTIPWMKNNKKLFKGYWIVSGDLLSKKNDNEYIQQEDMWIQFKINSPKDSSINYKNLSTLQILKNCNLNFDLEWHDQFLINAGNMQQIKMIDQRLNDFLNCKLELGTSICNTMLSPVEHYHQSERYKLLNNRI